MANDSEDVKELGVTIAKEVVSNIYSPLTKCNTFSNKVNEDIMLWLEEYEISASSNNWKDELMIKRLPLFLQGPARSFYNVELANQTSKSWACIKKLLIDQFCPLGYKIHMRSQLMTKKQLPFQPVMNFIGEIHDICKKYNNKMEDDEIIQFIYEGMNPSLVQQIIIFNPKSIGKLILVKVEYGHPGR